MMSELVNARSTEHRREIQPPGLAALSTCCLRQRDPKQKYLSLCVTFSSSHGFKPPKEQFPPQLSSPAILVL
jgi:hypothetical protein